MKNLCWVHFLTWNILLESISETPEFSSLCSFFANVLTLRICRTENWTENWESHHCKVTIPSWEICRTRSKPKTCRSAAALIVHLLKRCSWLWMYELFYCFYSLMCYLSTKQIVLKRKETAITCDWYSVSQFRRTLFNRTAMTSAAAPRLLLIFLSLPGNQHLFSNAVDTQNLYSHDFTVYTFFECT